jgi:hypothetical protein
MANDGHDDYGTTSAGKKKMAVLNQRSKLLNIENVESKACWYKCSRWISGGKDIFFFDKCKKITHFGAYTCEQTSATALGRQIDTRDSGSGSGACCGHTATRHNPCRGSPWRTPPR